MKPISVSKDPAFFDVVKSRIKDSLLPSPVTASRTGQLETLFILLGMSGLIEDKGYFILPSQLFQNVAKSPDKDPELNIRVKGIFEAIEGSSVGTKSEDSFKGLFDDVDVTSNKLGSTLDERNDRLAKIIEGIRDLDFGSVRDASIDLFGDAYEYLMNMYASSAGKSGGEFFTPQEVSELLARIVIGRRQSVK